MECLSGEVTALIQASCKGVNLEGLPTNALEEVKGRPLLWHLIERVKCAKKIDKIVVVTADKKEDGAILEIAKGCGVGSVLLKDSKVYSGEFWWAKGSRVLYYYGIYCIELLMEIGEKLGIQHGVLIQDDTHLAFIDPSIIDKTVEAHLESDALLTSNMDIPGVSNITVFSFKGLRDVYNRHKKEAVESVDVLKRRVHLTEFCHDYGVETHVTDFSIKGKKLKGLNLYVNSKQKVALIREIYDRLYQPGKIVDSVEVLELLNDHPELLSHIVTEIDVEITNECNLRCIFCPRRIMKREKGYMTLDLFKKIIDELQGASVSISFTLYGEPLLHPLFLEMVRYAKDRRHSVYLYTNGTLLDEAKSRELIQIGLDGIIVSLDAARRDTYARIKESQGFEDVVKNIEGFLRVKREVRSINPRVGLQILKIKETNAEIKEFMDRWNWMGRVKKMIDYKKRVEQGSAKANKELWETFYLKAELPVEHVIVGHFNRYCDQIADRGVSDFTPRKRFLCRQLLEGVSVLWNGDVTLCRQDFDGKMVVGNLNDTPLKEILNNSYRIETIKAQSREDYTKGGLCSTCKEWYYSRG